jgi:MFS family permease
MSDLTNPTPAGDSAPWPRPAVGWYAVFVLLIAYLFSFVDRIILGFLVVPIKADLGVSDAAMGLLLGIAFAIFYTLMGLPIGWLADRFSRRGIIAIGVFLWSLATAACGLASSFFQLFIARIGVGVGEAALSPSAYSMIADYFPREKLGRALGVFVSGAFFGAGLAFLVGGAALAVVINIGNVELPLVGVVKPWQLTFFIVGLPGLAVAGWMMTVQEPARRGLSNKPIATTEVFRFMRAEWRLFVTHFVGFSLLSLVIVVVLTWGPTLFVRVHGFSQPEVGLKLGLILFFLSSGGVFAGGCLADLWQRAGHTDAPLRVGILAALTSVPFAVAGNLASNADLAIALYCPMVFFGSLAIACAPIAIQLATPNQLRAQVSAMYMFSLNIISAILGPTGVGFITDYVFRDEMAVGASMALVGGVFMPLAALVLWLGRAPFRDAVEQRG